MMDTTIIKKFGNINSKINNLEKKLARFDNDMKFRLQELENMPKTRKAIKLKADILYTQSEIYRLKGFDRKYRSYMNQGSQKIKELKAISRYRKRKEIHNLNRNIREIKTRLGPLQEDQFSKIIIIKDILFNEFVGG